jgi:murein DD-endopeptidase MepM/ murein hydrolase activator NlpD
MSRRLLNAAIAVVLVAVAFVAFALPAAAEQRTFKVRLATGNFVTVTVDAPCVPMDQVAGLPGTPVAELTPPEVCAPDPQPAPTTPTQPAPAPPDDGGSQGGQPDDGGGDQGSGGSRGDRPSSSGGDRQTRSGSRRHADRNADPEVEHEGHGKTKKKRPRRADGVPTPDNPTYFDALPGPAPTTGVPNFVIQKFKVPIFLLPIYQAAGIQYGVRWEVLAAINEMETDYGRNLNVSSAGAVGWMQFLPSTWKMYGTDANRDGKRDPYNPVDAIFAAARYLKAAGADTDLRKAIFAYNHANWYVDAVLLRARLIAGYPPDFVGSLTGLTEGRFPVAARAKYADDALEAEQARRKKLKPGENAAQVIESDENRRGVRIFAREGAPVVAVNDGVVKRIGYSKERGRFLVLQDVYGNQYTYSGLGSVQEVYPVPKHDVAPDKRAARLIHANGDPTPSEPASAGTQDRAAPEAEPPPTDRQRADAPVASGHDDAQPEVAYKARLFAHPQRPNSRDAGGLEQIFDRETRGAGYDTYDAFFAKPIGLNAENSRLRPLKQGSKVVSGTILGRIGKTDPQLASHVYFEIRPAGKGAPKIDPKPILDGWKLLESTAVYRASGKNALYGETSAFSIGQVLLLPKPLLQKRVLADARIDVYPGGRHDIKTGQVDRRVLATLAYLAESGLKPGVTSLKSGHSFFTASGNVSHHSSGNAVDIATINGVSINGNQDPGGVTDQAVKRLMLLQGTMRPAQIISLLDYGANTFAMGDHGDHIHVGFQPMFGSNSRLGRQTASILEPDQWDDLIERLGSLEQPTVPTEPSKFALPAKKKQTAATTDD